MADIKVDLRVDSGGSLDTEAAKAKRLSDNLVDATRALEAYNRKLAQSNPGPSSGGTRSPANGPAPAGGGGGSNADARRTYNETTGTRGTGGSATSDFARQASGLGGLVHVYATFAANIFAVSAAFSALSKAVDTENMSKGLDQLGAASGKNLNAIAKQMVDVTDGAINLRTAMQSTAQASAAGISSENIMRLAKVARNASQALGREMPDAMDRLIRGSEKMQPMLLDELGILIRVRDANNSYARSLGRTAASLTDVEKRHGFVNEVIKQGEKKFNDINMVANPYAKILASVQNLAQSGLTLVNSFLGPVVRYLSESPTGLSLALGGMAVMLIKQAIPALGQWRQGLAAAALASRDTANRIAGDFKKFQESQANLNQPALKAALAAREAAVSASQTKLNEIATSGGRKVSNDMKAIMAKSSADVTSADMNTIKKEEERLRNRAATSTTNASTARSKASEDGHLREAKYFTQAAETTKAYGQQIIADTTARNALTTDTIRIQEELNKKQSKGAELSQRQRIADRAERTATGNQIVSNAGANTQSMGIKSAFSNLYSDIKNGTKAIGEVGQAGYQAGSRALTGLSAISTGIRGSFAIATGAVGTFLNAFGPWAQIIGLAIAGLTGLVSWLGTNNKQVEEFNTALGGLGNQLEMVTKTLDALSKKPLLEQFDIESVKIKANALSELSDSVSKMADTLYKANAAASGFDTFVNSVKKLWGGDLKSKSVKDISAIITDSMKLLEGPAKKQFEATMTSIFDTSDFTATGITKAMKDLNLEGAIAKEEQLAEAVKTANKASMEHSNTLENLHEQLGKAGQASQALTASLSDVTPMTTLANTMVAASAAMSVSLGSPIDSLRTMLDILHDVNKLSLLPKDTAASLIADKHGMEEANKQYISAQAGVEAYTKALNDAQAAKAKANKYMVGSRGDAGIGDISEEPSKSTKERDSDIATFTSALAENNVSLKAATASIKLYSDKTGKIAVDFLAASLATLAQARGNAQDMAAVTVAKAATAGLSGPGSADVLYSVQVQELEIQRKQLDFGMRQLTATEKNSAAIEALNLTIASGKAKEEVDRLQVLLAAATKAATPTAVDIDKATQVPRSLIKSIFTATPPPPEPDTPTNKVLFGQEPKAMGQMPPNVADLSAALIKAKEAVSSFDKTLEVSAKTAEILGLSTSEVQKRLTALTKENADDPTKIKQNAASIQQLQGALTNRSMIEAKAIAQSAAEEAAAISHSLALVREKAEILTRIQTQAIAKADLDMKEYASAQGLTATYIEQYQILKEQAATTKYNAEVSKENILFEATAAAARIADSKARNGTEEYMRHATLEHNNRLGNMEKARFQDETAMWLERKTREQAEFDRKQEASNKALESLESISKTELDVSQAKLSMEQSLNQVSVEYAANETERIAITQAGLIETAALRAIDQAKVTRDAGIVSHFTAVQSAEGNRGADGETMLATQKAYNAELVNSAALADGLTASVKATGAAEKTKAGYIAKSTLELDKQAKLISHMDSLTSSLTKVFGKVGTAIGGIGKSFITSAKTQVDIENQKQKDLLALREKGDDDQTSIEKVNAKYDSQAAQDKMQLAGDVAGAIGDSLDQQGTAAKVFHNIEKIMHMEKMAMKISEMVADGVFTGSSVINSGLRAAADGVAAVIKAIAGLPFPMNLVAGAATAAVVASLLGGGGKSVNANAAIGPQSSADKEKMQGTGQKFDAKTGLTSATGFGTLGDDTAKSESIKKSLDILATHSFDSLEYSNKMLEALQSIDKSMGGVSKTFALTTGLMSGSAFGTQEGSQTKFGGSVFGGNTQTAITGSGVDIRGTVGSLAAGSGDMNQYENVKHNKSGGWFSRDKEWYTKDIMSLGSDVKESLSSAFSNIGSGLVEIGSSLGLDAKSLTDTINQIPIDISIETKGLKGKELEDAVTSVFSATMDMMASTALSIVKPFQKYGEAMAETAVRVANDSRVIDLQLRSVGKSFGAVGIGSLAAREHLIDLAGGLDNFTKQSDFFKDNFLTEAEKLAPVQKAVTDELGRLGISSVTTMKQFKDLVLAQDVSTTSGSDMYTSLMKLENGFNTVYNATKEVSLSAVDLASAMSDQLGTAMDLLKNKTGSLLLTRQKELKGMDALLKPMQLWIYALQDESSARADLNTAYNTELSTRQSLIDSTKASSVTIKDFIKSLSAGDLSTLTPQQKYQQAKDSLSGVTAVLDNSLSSAADTTAALAALPNAITELLNTSKVFNASSDAYQQDYSFSQKILKDNADKLDSQVSTAQSSLDALTSQVTLLGGIDAKAQTIGDAITALTAAMVVSNNLKVPGTGASTIPTSSIPGFAIGGMASGLAIVGEQGPELVNFSNPGMVYTAGQTGNIFSDFGNQMADELASLRAEVCSLRADANRNAAMIAQSNLAVNREAANTVADAVTTAASNTTYIAARNTGKGF